MILNILFNQEPEGFLLLSPCLDLDKLINSAINEVNSHFPRIPLSNLEQERIEGSLLDKLPQDYFILFS